MKIALVHDYLKEYGGAERVLQALHEIFPEAPIYTIFCLKNSPANKVFKEAKIIQSWFGKLPFCEKLISPLRFLLPLIWNSFSARGGPAFGWDFAKYDLVISSASWAITKGFAFGKTKEICYCHTPPRYLYGYETSRDWKKNWFVRFYATVVNHFMRLYDFNRAQKVDFFIANSQEVQQRIKKFYRRDSVVINPPVETKQLTTDSLQQIAKSNKQLAISDKQYFLAGGRLELPKNFDLIIKACNQLKVPLKIYGDGQQKKYLESIAGPDVQFLGRITDGERQEQMAGCRAFIVAAVDEDFGITPVEAMAAGRPVIAYRGGGYLETVVEGSPRGFTPRGKTGIFFDEPTADSLAEAITRYNDIYHLSIKPEDCFRQAEKFSKERFKKEIMEFLDSHGFTTDSH